MLSSSMEIIISHEIRIPELNNQDSMESKGPWVICVAHWGSGLVAFVTWDSIITRPTWRIIQVAPGRPRIDR